MDVATILGLSIALAAIFGGFMLEGGHLDSIMQATAGIIVCGGTLGAVLVQFRLDQVKHGIVAAIGVLKAHKVDLNGVAAELVGFAQSARRDGLVSLESEVEKIDDPFLKKSLELAVDGSDSKTIRDAMEVELQTADEHGEADSKIFEAAGGYAPTVGILGAVLGLIHVMQNLADPSKLGAGIAVAFVATVYGVALANLFALPVAGKLKSRHQASMVRYELIITGVCGIVDGENPRVIERKLQGFSMEHAPPAEGEMKKAA